MKKRYRWMAAALAGMMAVSSFPALAAPTGPGAGEQQDIYDAETRARLEDNIIEYDEIALRVREYNPGISDAWRLYRDSKADFEYVVTELESQYREVKNTSDGYVDMGKLLGADSPAGRMLISSGRSLEKGYRSIIQSMRDQVNGWDDDKQNTKTIRMYERKAVAGVQQAMIGYETICQNMDTLEAMVRLYEQQSAMTDRMVALGTAVDTDQLSVRKSLLGAQSQLLSLKNQQDSVRRTLCLLLGYDPDTNPEIRPIPEFDMSRLDGMDLEADTKKAIGNNYTLISQRNSAKGETNSQIAARLNMINEGDEKLTIEMQRLYQDVMDKKAAYDAAVTGYTAAESSFGAAQRQYDLGLISQMQFTGLELSYYQKKAAKDSANLSLLQAMENYDWAIIGLAAVE